MQKFTTKSFGLFGGSFDPPHYGHLKISKVSIRRLSLQKLYWVVTKKNPFKIKPYFSLKERIKSCKKIIKKEKKISVVYIEDKIRSSRIVNVIKYFRKKNKSAKIYLIIGSDNLINFHKWQNYKKIIKTCILVVYSRKGFDKKAKKSAIINHLNSQNIIYIKNPKIDISSSRIRKFLKKT